MIKKRKTGLGRGISALIPDIESLDDKSGSFFMCKIEDIAPNRFQPRRSFPEEDLEKLKESIMEQGILQPLLVRKNNNGYELIAGERRLRAAKQADFTHVPTIIKDLSDEQMLEVSIIENVQRSNLNPLEESQAYHRLISEFHYTQEKVAQKIGKNRSTIANFLRLKGLPDEVKESLSKDEFSMGHARAILSAGSRENQIKTWQAVIEKQLSVRTTEQLAKKIKAGTEKKLKLAPEITPDAEYIQGLCYDLTRQINCPVSIKKKGERGKLEILFKNKKDLDRIVEMIAGIS